MIDAMGKNLIIRADANTQIGNGHVMRCLALAQAWLDAGGHAIFVMAMNAPALEARLRAEDMELIHISTQPGSADDALQTIDLAKRMDASAFAVDGYHFDAQYQMSIKDNGLYLLFLDDYGHADYYWADLVLNQNIYAQEGLYTRRAPYTQLFLGTSYVLLRRDFLKWKGWERSIPKVARKILVTLGGGDLNNATLKVIKSLSNLDIEDLEVVVVVGAGNPHHHVLSAAIEEVEEMPIILKKDVTNMPKLMAWADVAVSAGGSTSWELAFMGLPGLILGIAENQRLAVNELIRKGVFIGFAEGESIDAQTLAKSIGKLILAQKDRLAMSHRGKELVDGFGGNRVISTLI
jgi:UDP-2,4-diacetamido-2,4,6-trideoxy-beta-L-altropyranose hydrolase